MACKPRPNPVHIISLGGGVQSTTIALMAASGIITPTPKAAIFADTHSEPYWVYQQLTKLAAELPFPIEIISRGNLGEDSITVRTGQGSERRYLNTLIPAFFWSNDRKMMIQRRCTSNYKIVPIRRASRRYFRQGIVQWIGISTDEAGRMRDSDVGYIRNRYPLIELGMSRDDCITWLTDNGHEVPRKSSCTFCPFHSDAYWSGIKQTEPELFADVVAYERRMHEAQRSVSTERPLPYLHRSGRPLDEVDFSQTDTSNAFLNECQGVCGV